MSGQEIFEIVMVSAIVSTVTNIGISLVDTYVQARKELNELRKQSVGFHVEKVSPSRDEVLKKKEIDR